MPEKKPKENKSVEEKEEKSACETDKTTRSKDQREKSYYYDDAYGYEVYDPNEDDEEEDSDVIDDVRSDNFDNITRN